MRKKETSKLSFCTVITRYCFALSSLNLALIEIELPKQRLFANAIALLDIELN